MNNKVLQVNKYYSPDIGGVETVVKQYSEYLTQESYDVTVLAVSKDFCLRTTSEEINGVKVVRCSSFGTFMSMPISLSFLFHYIILSLKCSVIHFHEPFPLASLTSLLYVLGVFRRKKIIVTWHSDIIKQKVFKSFVEIFQRLLLRRADIITTTSPNMITFSRLLSRYSHKVTVLPLSIVPNVYNIQDDSYILYLGRLSYYKGIDVLLKAYSDSNKKLKLILVGDGDNSIVQLINEYKDILGNKLEFVNRFVTENEKWEYIRRCSFFVFPSVQPSEAFGIIQLEAMLCSKPVINTNLPTGVPYVSLDNVSGITVEPNNIDELRIAINKLSSDEDYRNRLGIGAKDRVYGNFTNDKVLESLLKIYN